MIRRRAAPAVALAAALALLPAAAPAAGDAVEAARAALADASKALEAAASGEEKLRALGRAAAAAEGALGIYRGALRAMGSEAARLAAAIEADAAETGRLVSALHSLGQAPRSALLAFPGGPVDAIRAASLMAAITPALDRRRIDLALRLDELSLMRARQEAAAAEVQAVLAELQRLRAVTAQAVIERTGAAASHGALSEQARAAAARARDLDGLSATLDAALGGGPASTPSAGRPALVLPVAGEMVAGFGEADPWGRRGEGITIAAPAWAEVRAPADATIRYAGPLADYGQVVVLEPEAGTLVVLAGLGRVSRGAGDEVLAGEPIGDLGGLLPSSEEFLLEATAKDGAIMRGRLYIELRQEGEAIDPAPWFGSGDKRGP